MITRELLRSIRNELPMKLTVHRLGCHGSLSKQSDGYYRFGCPYCRELRATVNPKNSLAHCFSCGKNINNIDLLMLLGHDFVPAVAILAGWLNEHRRDARVSRASEPPIRLALSEPRKLFAATRSR